MCSAHSSGPEAEPSEEAVHEALAECAAALRAAYDAYGTAVEERLVRLRAAVEEACERHAALRRDLALERVGERERQPAAVGGGGKKWKALWQRICTYRRRVRDEILAPLRQHLEAAPLGAVLTEQRAVLEEALTTLVREAPASVRRTEPADLYDPTPGEAWRTTVQKHLVRRTRQLQSLFGGDAEGAVVQAVPVRALLRRRVGTLMEQQPALDAVDERIMGWMGTVERAVAAVSHALLEFEQRIDHLDFHQTQAEVVERPSARARAADRAVSLEGAPASPPDDALAAVQRTIEAFDAALEAGAGLAIDDLRASLHERVEDALARLRTAVDEPGPAPSTGELTPPDGPDWTLWDEQARTRLELCETMIGFYAAIEERRDALIEEVQTEGPLVVQDRIEAMVAGLDEQEEALAGGLSGDEAGARLEAPLNAALSSVRGHLDALRTVSFGERLRTVVKEAQADIRARIAELPETVTVHPVPPPDASPDPTAPEQTVTVREGAAITFDVLFFDRLQSSAQRVTDVMGTEVDRLEQVVEVLEFGRTSAREEEPSPSAPMPHRPADTQPQEAYNEVQALVRGSVRRSRRLLRAREARVEAASYEWADTVWQAFRSGMTRLHKQWETERPLRGRIVRLTRQVTREARDAATEARTQVHHGRRHLQKWLEWGQRWIEGGVSPPRLDARRCGSGRTGGQRKHRNDCRARRLPGAAARRVSATLFVQAGTESRFVEGTSGREGLHRAVRGALAGRHPGVAAAGGRSRQWPDEPPASRPSGGLGGRPFVSFAV